MEFVTTSGALGTAMWNFADERHQDLIEIVGDDGRLELSTLGDGPLQLRRSGKLEVFELQP